MAAFDWSTCVRATVEDLGGKERLVPGAKLRARMTELFGEDVSKFITTSWPRTFAQLVEGARNDVPNLQVIRRPGTDFLVGYEGASPSAAARVSQGEPYTASHVILRDDVFAALTRVSERPFAYVPAADQFTTDYTANQTVIPLPQQTLNGLMDLRRSFAQQLDDTDKRQELIASIDGSSNPLGYFNKRAIELGVMPQWRKFNIEAIVKALEAWAKDNKIDVSPTWFVQRAAAANKADTPQEILARLAQYMTDQEVRAVAIPFTAVENMYIDMISKRRAG